MAKKDTTKYEFLVYDQSWAAAWREISNVLKEASISPSINGTILIFKENLIRTSMLATLPRDLAFVAAYTEQLTMRAMIKAGDWTEQGLEGLKDMRLSKGAALAASELSREMGDEKLLNEVANIVGCRAARAWSNQEKNKPGFLTVYRSIIIESWLIFEVFAGDFWATSVDHGPKIIAGRVMDYEEWDKEDKIKVKDVCKLPFDPRSSVGSFYREIGKASFQKLSSIRKNFEIIIGKHDKKFLTGDLDLLNAYRNALVHRAGLADRFFREQVQRFPEFRDIKEGEAIPLDGEIVVRLRKAAIDAARELITKVVAIQDPTPAT